MAVKPIPDGYHSVQPYLMVKGAKGLLEFLKKVFDATEIENMSGPDGTVMHAEVKIGDSIDHDGRCARPLAADNGRALCVCAGCGRHL